MFSEANAEMHTSIDSEFEYLVKARVEVPLHIDEVPRNTKHNACRHAYPLSLCGKTIFPVGLAFRIWLSACSDGLLSSPFS